MSDSEEDRIDSAEEVSGDDLFGDGGDDNDDQLSDRDQPSSDLEADSDRDRDRDRNRNRDRGRRDDRADDRGDDGDEGGDDRQVKTKIIMGVHMFRHRTPKSKDGTLQVLRVPPFLSWNPQEYDARSFEPTKADLESSKSKYPRPVARFRKDPKTGELQSNAMVYRWSDGSVTMAVGDEHYEVQSKALAPPSGKPYQELQDSHYYAAAAHLSSNSLLVVGHLTEQFTVRPNKSVEDDALRRLADSLQAASRSASAAEGDMIIRTTQDPELQKKQAEMAEKEREKARRRRENAAARLDGVGGGRYGGRAGALSIGDLEGGRRGAAGGRKRGQPGAPRQKRRRPEYDSDDDLPHGAPRQEDYDLADDFIAPSDEEISEGDDDDEEILDDDDDDEDEARAPRSKRQKTADAEDDEDADADADLDDDAPRAAAAESSRKGRRHIIDDDDDDE